MGGDSGAAEPQSRLVRFVPPLIRDYWNRLARPPAPREIINTAVPTDGRGTLRAYIHPGTQLGRALQRTGRYEPETEDLMRRELRPGDVFLDIGANEGFLSALAGLLVGPTGMVLAVEPQGRLQALIEINLRINGVSRFRLFHHAVGGATRGRAVLSLYPETNTGQSGLIRKPRRGWTTLRIEQEEVSFVSPEDILTQAGVGRVDLVKVDVEGFEHKVVEAMLDVIRSGRVRALLLDYHSTILARQNVDPVTIHRSLIDAGMRSVGDEPRRFDSYVLYRSAAADPRPAGQRGAVV
jgi:FkbM family methyltransferase